MNDFINQRISIPCNSESKKIMRKLEKDKAHHFELFVENGIDRVRIRLGLSETVLDGEFPIVPSRVVLRIDF